MWSLGLIFLLGGALAAPTHNEHGCDHEHSPAKKMWFKSTSDGRVDALDIRVSRLATKVDDTHQNQAKNTDHINEVETSAKEILGRLERVEPAICPPDHFSCKRPIAGDDTHHCITELHVCDGHNDCEDGWDEDDFTCKLRAPVGSVWETHYLKEDACTTRQPKSLKLVINSVATKSWFNNRPKLTYTIILEMEDEVSHEIVNIPSEGFYNYATGRLVVQPPEDDRLGLICTFDGVRDDRCHGGIFREASLDICAEFTLKRTDH